MHINKTRTTEFGCDAGHWQLESYGIEPLTGVVSANLRISGWKDTAAYNAGSSALATETHRSTGGNPWPFSEAQVDIAGSYEDAAYNWLLTLSEFSGGAKVN